MSVANEWSKELLEALLADGPEEVLSLLAEHGPVQAGAIGLLWDPEADSFEALALAQTLAELGRDVEATDVIEAVAYFQFTQSAAA